MKIIISGGGTGGHLFPALALADAMKLQFPDSEIIFVGAKNKMEMDIVPKRGYKIIGLYISGFHRRRLIRNIFFLFKLKLSIIHSLIILIRHRPNVVIGTGGFASGPILFCSSIFGIPTLIQEQNSFPGITNRILGKFVNRICVAYQGMNKYFDSKKVVLTGNPIRKNILNAKKRTEDANKYFNLSDKKTVLVLGGSLGAKTINDSISNFITNNNFNFQIIWQTGKLYYQDISKNTAIKKDNVKVFPFISEIDLAFAAADIIISRAGAITLSELMFIGKPVILIPSPNVSENHQYKNAKILEDNNAAILVEDKKSKNELSSLLLSLINNQERMDLLSSNIFKMFKDNSINNIIEEVDNILK
tara:strand:+ start:738 stop:1820 length:1083 start_codon:yes stop_codon:yes gene_type:complete